MTFDKNLKLLKKSLRQYGWELSNEDIAFEYFSNYLNMNISFPKDKSDPEYVKVLVLSLKKTGRLCPEILNYPLYSTLLNQCKNLRHKYKKQKDLWILLEPNCKYIYSEVPDIYVPEKYIFAE